MFSLNFFFRRSEIQRWLYWLHKNSCVVHCGSKQWLLENNTGEADRWRALVRRPVSGKTPSKTRETGWSRHSCSVQLTNGSARGTMAVHCTVVHVICSCANKIACCRQDLVRISLSRRNRQIVINGSIQRSDRLRNDRSTGRAPCLSSAKCKTAAEDIVERLDK